METELSEALAILGYSPRWIEYGLLPRDELDRQLQRYQSGEDRNTEHYRYAAFRALLRTPPLSDTQVQQYFELACLESDEGMARSALHDLLFLPELTDAQFEHFERHPWFGPDARPVRRQRLLRMLRREGAPPPVLERCLADGDGAVHEALLSLPGLPRHAVEFLAQSGESQRVRNMASALLHGKGYRNTQ